MRSGVINEIQCCDDTFTEVSAAHARLRPESREALGDLPFARDLDPEALDRATRRFMVDLGTLSEFPTASEPTFAARLAHALVTPALILGHPTLADACKTFETVVRDGLFSDASAGNLLAQVKLSLALLRGEVGVEHTASSASGGRR